mmetsp:Transcript_52052/g.160352  ORF Transcript_52052/g.160352 Transcript_52052/m.160352 type:complete len:264 (-) Transcript_52052:129-920(-)
MLGGHVASSFVLWIQERELFPQFVQRDCGRISRPASLQRRVNSGKGHLVRTPIFLLRGVLRPSRSSQRRLGGVRLTGFGSEPHSVCFGLGKRQVLAGGNRFKPIGVLPDDRRTTVSFVCEDSASLVHVTVTLETEDFEVQPPCRSMFAVANHDVGRSVALRGPKVDAKVRFSAKNVAPARDLFVQQREGGEVVEIVSANITARSGFAVFKLTAVFRSGYGGFHDRRNRARRTCGVRQHLFPETVDVTARPSSAECVLLLTLVV